MNYLWSWGPGKLRALDRKGARCRVVARGIMNSALVEFADGQRVVVSRNGLRRDRSATSDKAPARLVPTLGAQLDLDGRLHDLAPQTERMRLFEPAPTQIEGQTYIDTPNERQGDGH